MWETMSVLGRICVYPLKTQRVHVPPADEWDPPLEPMLPGGPDLGDGDGHIVGDRGGGD